MLLLKRILDRYFGIPCCSQGFDKDGFICVTHLELAYNKARKADDKPLMAAILWKQSKLEAKRIERGTSE